MARLVQDLRRDLDSKPVELAFLQLASPDVDTGLGRLLERGCDDILVLSMFLVSGNHHTHDCESQLRRILDHYPGAHFTLTEPLLLNPGLYRLILERCSSVVTTQQETNQVSKDIEDRSFAIIDSHLAGLQLGEAEYQVARRVAHATADPDLARTLVFHPQAMSAAMDALRRGLDIVVDARMVAAGMDRGRARRLGANLVCSLSNLRAPGLACQLGITRSQAAMRETLATSPASMVIVGNAPTALEEVIDSVEAGRASPPLIVGVPVGYVGASEAKRRLAAGRTPFITNTGQRGGSAMAVAIANALLRLAENQLPREKREKEKVGGAS
ncbi:MAG: precorrin-8X methylmutase [Chloroflexi bacterium]|nr:precorrin-8X methylmutase [Chloroflexota bacterium]